VPCLYGDEIMSEPERGLKGARSRAFVTHEATASPDRPARRRAGYRYTRTSIAAILVSSLLGIVVSLSTFLVIGATSRCRERLPRIRQYEAGACGCDVPWCGWDRRDGARSSTRKPK
jgi:hypothetical protein